MDCEWRCPYYYLLWPVHHSSKYIFTRGFHRVCHHVACYRDLIWLSRYSRDCHDGDWHKLWTSRRSCSWCGYFRLLCRGRSEEHTSELQSRFDLVCRLLLEKKKVRSGIIPVEERQARAGHGISPRPRSPTGGYAA